MRLTLHLAAADDYPAYHQLARQARMRTWRKTYPHLDEEQVAAELRDWFATPRGNAEIRERVGALDGVADDPWTPVIFARTLLALVQLPPAGHWDDKRRPSFVADPRPLPVAVELPRRTCCGAISPRSGRRAARDVAAWAGVAQRDFADACAQVETVSYRDEQGTELFDLPGAPLPPASTRLPVRLLAHWDQPLLAYADRDRIIPPELLPLKLTLSGDPTVTVDGRVAASWSLDRDGDTVTVTVTPHTDIPRAAHAQIRAEAKRIAAFAHPGANINVPGTFT